MNLQGTWEKDKEGYMSFNPPEIQRYYEVITDQYHDVFNRHLEQSFDEEMAAAKAREEGYQLITDYKMIDGREEFATTYKTPSWELDLWYELDPVKGKRIYEKGFIKVSKK